jgi:hypothetical protein
MMFINQMAFDDVSSQRLALGQNLNPATAVKSAEGRILFYKQTGGMIAPQKTEIRQEATLYRFAGSHVNGQAAMLGGWWVGASEFERILSFARVHNVSDPMAARILCGVPPEWSDMGLLVRARVKENLLAWRGLANSVIVPHPQGGPHVTMMHQNAIAERRLYQLLIPGLDERAPGGSIAGKALTFDGQWPFHKAESKRGWLYL